MQEDTNKMINDFLMYYHRFWGEMRDLKQDFKGEFPSEFKFLIDVGYYENQPMYVIAEQMKISRSYITSLIEVLVERGMITRVTDNKDRRMKRIILTAEGRKFRKGYLEAFEKNWEKKLSSLSFKEHEELYKSIETIKKVSLKIQAAKE